jgi:serine/threonine protein kinase
MGALYLAVSGDRGLERLMVIKTVLPHLADAEYVARFRDEAKVVVKLSHGNLIPVFDAGLVGGELFLAMDFVEGRDLRAVWNRCAKKQVAFPIDVAVFIIKELCRGLAYAHSFPDLHLVHRDVSPPNVLVSYTGEVKLTDFGLASSTLKLEKTAPGIIYGKVAYMSPEQARGEKLDSRSDMYAAAIVLWELLTGRQLYPPGKDQPQDLLARAKNPEALRPSKRAPRVPPELDDICLKALSPERADRYKDCDEMRMALQSWLAQNAPTTDGTRMSAFLEELFSDDIKSERVERHEMLARVRTRALTLPPTDELRRWVEKSSPNVMPGARGSSAEIDDESTDVTDPLELEHAGDPANAPVRKPGSVGRRATDRRDTNDNDRRQVNDRRGPSASPSRAASPVAAAAAVAEAEPDSMPSAEVELVSGSEIDGRYRIVELIGEGGMGKVYLAEHVEIGKRVALKVLHPSYSRMPDLVERFRREARAASKIGHPNIVDVTDSGTTADGSVYFVMEYLEGVELGSVIEREGALDVYRGLKIAGQICRALSAAHAVGIIHRDLKPENIFLIARDGAADVVKVLDFGIAKTTEAEAARERRLTSPGMAMGTPEYMAPEQAAGRPADARTDVYALGAIMYEMVTGVPPYEGDNFMEILTKKATTDPPPPVTIRSELPAQVSDLVMAAMARQPESRPQTMEALEYELNKCLAGRGVAVAQILGMTTDATVVASLNPGLSMRTLDDGIVRPASSPAIVPTMGRANTQSGLAELAAVQAAAAAYQSGPAALASGAIALATGRMQSELALASGATSAASSLPRLDSQAGPSSRPSDRISATMLAGIAPGPSSASQAIAQPVQPRSAASILGWLLLAALLFGGVGAILFVAFGERGNHANVNAPAANAADAAAMMQPVAPSEQVGSGSSATPIVQTGPTQPESAAPIVGSNDAADDLGIGSAAKRPPGSKTLPNHAPKHPVAIADEHDAGGLVRQGLALQKQGEYEMARAVYQKLEKLKGWAGPAEYYQATVAYDEHDTPNVVALASKAETNLPASSPMKRLAMMLYGDGLFQQGSFDRAKNIYVALYKQVAGDMREQLKRKVVLCNGKLHKDPADGL